MAIIWLLAMKKSDMFYCPASANMDLFCEVFGLVTKQINGRAYIDIMTPLVDTSKMEIRKNQFVSDYTHPNDDGHLSLFTRIDSAYKKLTN